MYCYENEKHLASLRALTGKRYKRLIVIHNFDKISAMLSKISVMPPKTFKKIERHF
jgi:hypothetical protein